jgi:hypothetical protein
MNRTATLATALTVLFMVVALILGQLLPGPHRPTDYLVIGGAATMVCLLAMFVILLSTNARGSNLFFSRRKKQ